MTDDAPDERPAGPAPASRPLFSGGGVALAAGVLIGALLFLLGFFVGRESVREGTVAAPTASPTPTPSPTAASPGLDVDVTSFAGLWLFEFSETSDPCGRFPAIYSDRLEIAAANDTIRIPESVPPGTTTQPGARVLQASGPVSRSGVFTANAEETLEGAAGEPEPHRVEFAGSFRSVQEGSGGYTLRRGACEGTYSFSARKLT